MDIEAQTRLELRGKTATLAGWPDIIDHRKIEAVTVDAKTGHERPSHTVQVMIYPYAIPRALERYRSAELRRKVAYRVPVAAAVVSGQKSEITSAEGRQLGNRVRCTPGCSHRRLGHNPSFVIFSPSKLTGAFQDHGKVSDQHQFRRE